MKINELVADFAHTELTQQVAGITANSRQVRANYAFIALAGATEHGLKYASQAIASGATAIIYDLADENLADFKNLAGLNVALIGVADLASNLPAIAARFYDHPAQQLDIIGITGTNGKTSCSQFLAQIFTDATVIGTLGWGTWGSLKTTGYTTPDALLLQQILAETVAAGRKKVIMEVSSHGIKEGRIEQTCFKGAVFTNLSRDHLDYHGSMEDYFVAKLQLFKRPELAFAVINQDDEYGQKIIAELAPSVTLWTFSKQEQTLKNCLVAKNAYCDRTGIGFQACCNGETVQINSALYGEFNIENLLAVLTTLLALGFALPDAAEKIATLQPVSGRMEHFGSDTQAVVFVDYAHTPDALDKVLAGVKKHNPQQLWVVFGCGGNRDQGKRALMGKIAQQWADKIILTDDNPRYEDAGAIVQAVLQGCHSDKVTVIQDRAKAIQTAITQAHKNDCVVIAGKGHESYQEINGVKTPFSDQEIVKETLALWTK